MVARKTPQGKPASPPRRHITDTDAARLALATAYARLRAAGTLTPEIAQPLLRLRDALHRIAGIDASQPREESSE